MREQEQTQVRSIGQAQHEAAIILMPISSLRRPRCVAEGVGYLLSRSFQKFTNVFRPRETSDDTSVDAARMSAAPLFIRTTPTA